MGGNTGRSRLLAARRPRRDDRSPLKVTDETFERASSFLRRQPSPGGGAPWYRDPAGAVAVARVVRALPVQDVRLTSSVAGRAIAHQLSGRSFGVPRIRLCAAVCEVPESVPDRPSGKHNQAIRTAMTAADAAGMTVAPVPDTVERRNVAKYMVEDAPWHADWADSIESRDLEDWLVAYDAGGRPAGVGSVIVDDTWAALVTLIGLPGSPLQSHARYVLHHRLLQLVSQRGVRTLGSFEHSALLLPAQTRHLQHILGYRAVRLREPIMRG